MHNACAWVFFNKHWTYIHKSLCIRTLAYGISSTNTRITYIKHGKGLELVDLLPMLTFEAPFDNDKGNGANGSKDNQNRELHIQS